MKNEPLAQVFSCEFCKIRPNTFFAEHQHQTTASDYSNNNSISNEGRIGKRNWYKNHVQLWVTIVTY